MRKVKITIIGNSVAIRIRPLSDTQNNKNYAILLEELLESTNANTFAVINNTSFTRATIIDLIKNTDNYLNDFSDYYILNIGIPDASTREIPFWFANIINQSNHSIFVWLFKKLHSEIFAKKRALFVKLRGKRTWVKESLFKRKYEELVKLLMKETNAKIIAMSISLPNERIEKAIPGTYENCIKYNKIIEEICQKNNIVYLNLDFLEPENHYPDGIHYSQMGHEIVANKIFEQIEIPK